MNIDLFGKSGDQLAKERIEEYRKGKDEFAVIDGFGKIAPIATEEDVKNFLLKQA